MSDRRALAALPAPAPEAGELVCADDDEPQQVEPPAGLSPAALAKWWQRDRKRRGRFLIEIETDDVTLANLVRGGVLAEGEREGDRNMRAFALGIELDDAAEQLCPVEDNPEKSVRGFNHD